ncbi:hypothetical protein FHT32_003285 [Variovorax sp. SG517]|uniref:DUF3540 domain-containing protein n=1 Tax=Variovorax sp. SG517 TaxID=2587117 RepID=UPI00159D53B6|nr:DUF3540 domain-containing protein [Variovorax sp. SG517]NVM89628.1 hypothetical protein [Variovorax sp. SG517]
MNATSLRSPPTGQSGSSAPRTGTGASAEGVVNALGTVTSVLPGGLYSVDSDGRLLRCQRAASCLLRPEIGDLVLVSGPDANRLYLTAVAEQADANTSRLDVNGDLTLASERGSVRVESAAELSLKGGTSLRMASEKLEIDAAAADCSVSQLAYRGEEVQVTALGIRVIGRVYEAIVDRLVHLSKTAFRMTDGIDQVRAGHIDYHAEEMARLHGKNTVVTAQDLIKTDASQIHMG